MQLTILVAGEIVIRAPYSPANNEKFREFGGVFDRPSKSWRIPDSPEARQWIAEQFGQEALANPDSECLICGDIFPAATFCESCRRKYELNRRSTLKKVSAILRNPRSGTLYLYRNYFYGFFVSEKSEYQREFGRVRGYPNATLNYLDEKMTVEEAEIKAQAILDELELRWEAFPGIKD